MRQMTEVAGVADQPKQVVKHMDFMYGGYRFVGTVTRVHDPEAVRRADEFVVGCIIRRLPEIRARMEREDEQARKAQEE